MYEQCMDDYEFVGGVSVYWLFGVGTNYKQNFNFHVKEEKIKANWLKIPIG